MPLTMPTPAPIRDRLLTLRDVAERLNVNVQTVRRLALNRKIRSMHVARHWRFRESWVDEFIEKQSR